MKEQSDKSQVDKNQGIPILCNTFCNIMNTIENERIDVSHANIFDE